MQIAVSHSGWPTDLVFSSMLGGQRSGKCDILMVGGGVRTAVTLMGGSGVRGQRSVEIGPWLDLISHEVRIIAVIDDHPAGEWRRDELRAFTGMKSGKTNPP